MLGKPGTVRPVHSSYCAAEWTTRSPWQERSTAMSSMQLATCGNRSDTSTPLCAVLGELARRAEQLGVALNKLIFRLAKLRRPRLAVELVQQRLGIERLQVAGTAGHHQEDDRLRFRSGQVRFLRRQRIGRGGAELFLVEQREQRQAAEATEGLAQEIAARPRNLNVHRHHGPSIHIQERVHIENRQRKLAQRMLSSGTPSDNSFSAAVGIRPVVSQYANLHLLRMIRAGVALQPFGERFRQRFEVLPFSISSACNACVLVSRRGQLVCRSGWSNAWPNGSRRLRFASR